MPQPKKVALISGGSRGLGAEARIGIYRAPVWSGDAELGRRRPSSTICYVPAGAFTGVQWMDAIMRRCAPS